HERQRPPQQRPAARRHPRPRARPDQGRAAPEVPAGFPFRRPAAHRAREGRAAGRVDRRQRRSAFGGLIMRALRLAGVAVLIAFTANAWADDSLLAAVESGDRERALQLLSEGADALTPGPD